MISIKGAEISSFEAIRPDSAELVSSFSKLRKISASTAPFGLMLLNQLIVFIGLRFHNIRTRVSRPVNRSPYPREPCRWNLSNSTIFQPFNLPPKTLARPFPHLPPYPLPHRIPFAFDRFWRTRARDPKYSPHDRHRGHDTSHASFHVYPIQVPRDVFSAPNAETRHPHECNADHDKR